MKYKFLKIENVVKIGLSVLLFLCLFKMPYGFFQLVKVSSTFVFIYFAFKASNNDKHTQLNKIFFVGLAILFQPFFKIALGRQIWNIVDVLVGIILIVSVFFNASNGKYSV